MKNIIAFALFCMLVVSEVSARKIEDWPYERLFKESDLVVIAHVQGWGVTKKEWNEKLFDKRRFEGVTTIFGANFVLKGDPPLCIWLNHFRYKEGAVRYNDSPGLVAFLKERKDDTYEPVSGQMDASFSVRAIFSPDNISIR